MLSAHCVPAKGCVLGYLPPTVGARPQRRRAAADARPQTRGRKSATAEARLHKRSRKRAAAEQRPSAAVCKRGCRSAAVNARPYTRRHRSAAADAQPQTRSDTSHSHKHLYSFLGPYINKRGRRSAAAKAQKAN